MEQSVNIPWVLGMDYGMGVNLLNGQVAGKGVEPGDLKGGEGGQVVTYNMQLLNTMEELYSSIGISIESSGSYGLFSGDGKFKYSKEAKFNSQSTFLLARCVVQNPFTQAEEANIKLNAGELIKQGKTDVFQFRYGDGFVRGMLTGGEFFAVISITSSNRDEQNTIATSLQAKYGGFFASADVSASLDDQTKSKISKNEIRVSTYQRGGQGDQQGFTKDIEAVMARLQAFPSAVIHNPVPFEVQVANYQTLELPEGPNTIDIKAQKEALEDFARLHIKLMTVRNDIEFLQLHPDYFVNPPNPTTLNQWNEFISDQIRELKRQASKCVDSPKDGCGIFPLKLPDGFAMPERTRDVSGTWQHTTEYDGRQFTAKWTFNPIGGNRYDAQEEGLGNAKGIAVLHGNHFQIDFTAAGGTTGRYEWDLNADFTIGVGKLLFTSADKDKNLHDSQLIHIN
jgi:hypothetical protein